MYSYVHSKAVLYCVVAQINIHLGIHKEQQHCYGYDASSLQFTFHRSLLLKFHLCFQTGMIDMENDWKLLTILIGGNDLCDR